MPVSMQDLEDFKHNLENTSWNYKPTKKEYELLGKIQDVLADFLGYFQDKVVEDKPSWEM